MITLFPADALHKALARFPLSKLPDIRSKRAIISEWIKQLQSGKLVALKEEEVKSRFVTEVFGDVLGFNYGNSTFWQLREEVRTKVDATKPDAALGYFSHDGQVQVCRAVIEIKDAATDLDAKQRRVNPKSAVDQGFEYAPKMGPDCQWVIVSNIKEIRFYRANDRTKCQRYLLAELGQDDKLKELLLLFHKDRFIVRAGESKTDKLLRHAMPVTDAEEGRHIVDELYTSLQRFDGLRFVNPNYLAGLYPFNILEEHVWHYEEGALLTINPHICRLLDGLFVQDKQLELSVTLLEELVVAGVVNCEEKLKWIITFLNRCHITHFRAVWDYQSIVARHKSTIGFSEKTFFSFAESDGVEKELNLLPSGPCSCLICMYRNLDLKPFLGKLKSAAGHEEYETMEYAYGNYLAATNNFRAAHDIYKHIEQQTKNQEGDEITYFLAKQNRLLTHNLLRGHYYQDDQKQLLSDIREIDMVSVVSDELEGAIEPEVRAYLLDVTSKDLVYKVKDELEEKKQGLINRKLSVEQSGWFSGPNYLLNAWYQYILLYRHVNLNYLVYDTFDDYRNVAKRLVEAAILSYSTAKVGERTFDKFFLNEAIFHVEASDLAKLLQQINTLEVTLETKQELLAKTNKLLHSFYEDGIFGDPYLNPLVEEFMLNWHFKQRITNAFSNLLLLLARVPLEIDDLSEIASSLIGFMRVERYLGWNDIEHLALFLRRKGKLLSQSNLLLLLQLALLENRRASNRYEALIEPIVEALHEQYPAFRIEDKNLIRKVVGNCYAAGSTRAGFKHLSLLHRILSPMCLIVLQTAIREHLDEQFDADLYRSLLWDDALIYTEGNYFAQWVAETNSTKGNGYQGVREGRPKFENYDFLNFTLLIYAKGIPLETPELQQFSNLSLFEQWLIQPEKFDYTKFELNWLAALNHFQFFNRLKQIEPLRQAIQKQLDLEFSPKVYELYHNYFLATR